MNDELKELIYKLFENDISENEFKNKFFNNREDISGYISELLGEIINEKNSEDLELLIYLCFKYNLFTDYIIDMLCEIFEDDWHYKHEDIALLFEEARPIKAINSLYRVAISKYPYLDFDDNYALAVKCIWALGEINTMESKKALERLAVSENEIIKKNALKQLNMRKFDRLI